jgi:hypothetical protein
MPIVQAGKQFTKEDLLATAGNLAALLVGVAQDCDDYRIQLETWTDADLLALGLTQEQVNAQKGFFVGDVPGILTPIKGSVWIKQLLGTGV